jgi:hypothetical protein
MKEESTAEKQQEAASLQPGASAISPEPVDWEHATLLSANEAYGLIYRIAPNLVAKVGFILPEETDLQQRLAARGQALPVLEYALDVSLPLKISQMFCAKHGRRVLPEDMIICFYGAPLIVLLMPKTDTAIWDRFDALTIAEFMEEVSTYCFEELGHTWDAEERNLAIYQGHLVALDFGDPEADCY